MGWPGITEHSQFNDPGGECWLIDIHPDHNADGKDKYKLDQALDYAEQWFHGNAR